MLSIIFPNLFESITWKCWIKQQLCFWPFVIKKNFNKRMSFLNLTPVILLDTILLNVWNSFFKCTGWQCYLYTIFLRKNHFDLHYLNIDTLFLYLIFNRTTSQLDVSQYHLYGSSMFFHFFSWKLSRWNLYSNHLEYLPILKNIG